MKFYKKAYSCLNCRCGIESRVFDYSSSNLGFPLCISCQNWLKEKADRTTQETIELYFSLKKRGINAELEKDDGFKTIDIAIVEARINIEVDGGHHNYSAEQALADLKRTYHSFKKGYFTIRIPNALVKTNLGETTEYITMLLKESKK